VPSLNEARDGRDNLMSRHDESQRRSKQVTGARFALERRTQLRQLSYLGEGQRTVEIAHGNSLIEAPFVFGQGNSFHRVKKEAGSVRLTG